VARVDYLTLILSIAIIACLVLLAGWDKKTM
jgi:hypothetical protein